MHLPFLHREVIFPILCPFFTKLMKEKLDWPIDLFMEQHFLFRLQMNDLMAKKYPLRVSLTRIPKVGQDVCKMDFHHHWSMPRNFLLGRDIRIERFLFWNIILVLSILWIVGLVGVEFQSHLPNVGKKVFSIQIKKR